MSVTLCGSGIVLVACRFLCSRISTLDLSHTKELSSLVSLQNLEVGRLGHEGKRTDLYLSGKQKLHLVLVRPQALKVLRLSGCRTAVTDSM